MSNNHLNFIEQAKKAYSEKFMDKICKKLSITDDIKKKDFCDCVMDFSVNYLDANEINTDRIPAHKQKKIIEDYRSSLKKAQRKFRILEHNNATSSEFHGTLREEIAKTESKEIEEMFAPYIDIGEGEFSFWRRTPSHFDQLLEVIIKAAKEAVKSIEKDSKTSPKKQYLLEWVNLMRKAWPHFTDINFGLGDWLKNNELKGHDNQKGMYKSVCVDVLHDLIAVVDKEITRSDIEAAIRKTE